MVHPEEAHLLTVVQELLGHAFTRPGLLKEALTHSSFSNEKTSQGAAAHGDNERLEFLGDAVLGLVVADLLMSRYPEADEGTLSKWRSALVSRRALAELACRLQLGEYLMLGRGERRSGGAEKTSILASGFEAVVGALYLDGGIQAATVFLQRVFEEFLETLSENGCVGEMVDKKTHLQERTQSHYKTIPEYRLVETWGREHEKNFRVEIRIQGKVITSAEGRSKKDAEQAAASLALEILEF